MLQLFMISMSMLLISGAKVKDSIINVSNISRNKNRNKGKDKEIGIDSWMTGIGVMQYNTMNKLNLINSTIKCIHNISQSINHLKSTNQKSINIKDKLLRLRRKQM